MKEIRVYKNKDLKEVLELEDINHQTIKSLDIKLYFKKWCSYEDGVVYTDLEYQGYKYEMEGILEEKWSDAQLYFKNKTPIKVFNEFIDCIQDHELKDLEDKIDYEYIGEPDTWNFVKVLWLDDTPENIKHEFHEKYIESDRYDELKGENIRYDGGGGNFYKPVNNIHCLELEMETGKGRYKIEWINKFPEFPYALLSKKPENYTNEDWTKISSFYEAASRFRDMTTSEFEAEDLNTDL